MRMGVIDKEIDFLNILPQLKQLQINSLAHVSTKHHLNYPDVLLEQSEEFKNFIKDTYSRLEDAIKFTKINSRTADEWLKAIEKAASQAGGVSKEEIKWSGIEKIMREADELAITIKKDKVIRWTKEGLDKIKPKVKVLKGFSSSDIESKMREIFERKPEEWNWSDEENFVFDTLSDDAYESLRKEAKKELGGTRYDTDSEFSPTAIGGAGYKEVVFYTIICFV